MTEPSQYFKGRTVQEQMNEVIGYVDARAEEVAAAKADDVLEPAEQAKDDAIAAKEAAEQARDTTLAALPTIQQDITDLKAKDVTLDGRLDTVELKVQTAEGNIVTIQGQIVALQTADGQNVKLTGTHAIGNYAVLLTGNQTKTGILTYRQGGSLPITIFEHTSVDLNIPVTAVQNAQFIAFNDRNTIELATLMIQRRVDNGVTVYIHVRNADGTYKYVPIAVGDGA